MKKVSPGLSPTAAAIIHKAQAGRFSIPHVPPLHRRGGWRGDSQQPVNPCPISETTHRPPFQSDLPIRRGAGFI
jgi:hypothetical protein